MKKTRSGADVSFLLEQIKTDVKAAADEAGDAVSKTIADEVFRVSQEYVPQDTGDLAASGKVEKEKDGFYTVRYDDWKAFLVHENFIQEQPYDGRNGAALYGAEGNAKSYTTPGTGPKYLERAADQVANKSELVKALRDEMGRFKRRLPKS